MNAAVDKPLKVLILDDQPADAELIERALRKNGLRFTTKRVETRETFTRALDEFAPDVVLSDYKLPDFDGLAALRIVQGSHPDLPVIGVSGTLGDEAAVALVKAGFKDYVLKDRLARLPFAVEHALAEADETRSRRLAEAALRGSEEQYRTVVESALDGIVGLDLHGIVTAWNKGAEGIYGYAAGEIVGRSVGVLSPPERKGETAGLVGRVVRGERVEQFETERVTKQGARVDVAFTFAPIMDGAGNVTGVCSVTRDITERKRAERERAFDAAVLSAVQQIAGIYVIAGDGTFAYVNPHFAEMFGFTPAEAAGRPFLDFVAETDRQAMAERIAARFGGKPLSSPASFSLKRRDGTPIDVLAQTTLASYQGKPAVIGVMLDITERKRTEAALVESEAKFRGLVEQQVAGIAIIRDGGTVAYINPYFARMFGYAPDEISGRPLIDFVPETEKAIVADKLRSQLTGEGGFVQLVSAMRAKDGHIVDIMVNASPTTYQGRPASIAVVIDVTERKRAEIALRESQQLLQGILNAIPVRVFWKDRDLIYLGCNAAFARDAGFAVPEDIVGKDDYQMGWKDRAELYRADDRGVIEKSSSKLLIEEPQTTPGGRTLTALTSKIPLQDANGKTVGVLGSYMDITDRKRAEENLRASEERFRILVEQAPEAILLYDFDQDRFIDANKNAEKLFGCRREEIVKVGPKRFYLPDQPDARPIDLTYDEHNRRALDEEQVVFERHIRAADGRERICEVRLVRLPSAAGRLLRCSFIDITERKRSEVALRRLNRALKTLSGGNEVLVRATDEPELLREMCRVIVERGGYRLAWIGIPEHDAAKTVRPATWAGDESAYLEHIRIGWGDDERGRGIAGLAIRTGEPQASQDLMADNRMAPWRAEAQRHGIAAALVLPLEDASGVFAVLGIYSGERDAFNTDELALLRELASNLAYGIEAQRDKVEREAAVGRWRASLEAAIGALASTVEKRDPYTAGHQHRVSELAGAIAREMQLPERQIDGIHLAGIIHDVGKINVPMEILNKPGKLSPLEYQLIQEHVRTGYDIVKSVDFPWPIADMILQHHERLDGSGYPNGIKGSDMLLEAKILAVADLVEAMMSHRPYRAALGLELALAEIRAGKGRLYDAAVVDACFSVLHEGRFAFS